MSSPAKLIEPKSLLTPFVRQAFSAGLDTRSLLQRHHIPGALTAGTDQQLNWSQIEIFLQDLIMASDDPLFGLHAAGYIRLDHYGATGLACQYADKMETVLQLLRGLPLLQKSRSKWQVSNYPQQLCSRWHINSQNVLVTRHLNEFLAALWMHLRRLLLPLQSCESDIKFNHNPPPAQYLSEYQNFFNARVCFEQDQSGIDHPIAPMLLNLPQQNSHRYHFLLDNNARPVAQDTVTQQVKALLRCRFSHDDSQPLPDRDAIASQLSVCGRTLQRRLIDENNSYQRVVNEVRLEVATHYLRSTQWSLDVIACKLGYGESRSFYRSFKQWTGKTAGVFRKEIQQSA